MWKEKREGGREAGGRRASRLSERELAAVKPPVLSKHGTRARGHTPCHLEGACA